MVLFFNIEYNPYINLVCINTRMAFWLRMKLILGDSTETLSGFQTQDKILDLLSTPELLFKEKSDQRKQNLFLGKVNTFSFIVLVKNYAIIIDDATDALCKAFNTY